MAVGAVFAAEKNAPTAVDGYAMQAEFMCYVARSLAESHCRVW
jgi:hypothetical protein